MSDIPTPNPVRGGKNVLGKFKGLPPWAYLAAFGVGGVVIYWTISKSRANAATAAQDATGTDTGTEYATTAGDPYPNGGGAGVSTGSGSDTTSNNQDPWDFVQHLIDSGLLPTGGGTQSDNSSENHYTPPSITVNIPAAATPTPPPAPASSAPAPAPASHPWGNGPDPCTGEYPFYQDSGSRKGKCYKVVKKSGKDYRYYKGENLPIPV